MVDASKLCGGGEAAGLPPCVRTHQRLPPGTNENGVTQVSSPTASDLDLAMGLFQELALEVGDPLLRQRVEIAAVVAETVDGQIVETVQDEDPLRSVRVWPQLWWRARPDVPQLNLSGWAGVYFKLTMPPIDLLLLTAYLAERSRRR